MSEMNPIHSLKTNTSRCDRAFTALEASVRPLIEAVETLSPGSRFGARVYGHMLELSNHSRAIAISEGLNLQEEELLRFILGAHDVGRIVAEFQQPGNREYQHTHGEIGASFLRENKILSSYSEAEQNIICQAIEQHATKDVSLTPRTLEYRLCYILRDLDKAEIIARNADYIEPAGALVQIKMWMLTEPERAEMEALERNGDITNFRESIASILGGTSIPKLAFDERSSLMQVVIGHLTRPVQTEYVDRVADGGMLTKPEMISGYPAYMLAQIAMYRDVQSDGVRRLVKDNGDLLPRQRYLELVDPAAAMVARKIVL